MEIEEAAAYGRMLKFELEAAEALAGLSRSSAAGERAAVQKIVTGTEEQVIDAQQFFANSSTTVAGPIIAERTVDATPAQTCITIPVSKVRRTSRQNLTEAEKEARRISRILANRESARRTIYRRQSMHMDLTEKANHLSHENTCLKKEKELAVKKYHSLKDKNEFLKAQLAEIKKKRSVELQNPNSLREELNPVTTTTPTPISVHNQPSLLPLLWPSIVPSSDMFNLQCTSQRGIGNFSQIHIPVCENPSSYQGLNCSTGAITEPGTPLLLLPVPWLLPFLTHSTAPEHNLGTKDKQKETASVHQCCTCSAALMHDGNNLLSLNSNLNAEASKSVRSISSTNNLGTVFNFPPGGCSQNAGPHVKASVHVNSVCSAPEHTIHSFKEKNQGQPLISPSKVSGHVVDATAARKKRKALMKLKNSHCQDAPQ